MSSYDNYWPPTKAERIFVSPDSKWVEMLCNFGFTSAEYRGTDVNTGYELWQNLDPLFSFMVDPMKPKVVVFNIGSDFDEAGQAP